MNTNALSLCCALALAACSSDQIGSHSSTFSLDVDEGGSRRIKHVTDGLSRSISMDGAVLFEAGEIVEMDEGVTLVFEQSGDGDVRRGQVVVEDGARVLYVEDDGALRRGDADDEAWFASFLSVIAADDSPDDDDRLRELASDAATPVADVLAELHLLSFDSDQVDVLEELLDRDALTADEQVAIVEAAWGLSFASSKSDVVTELIARDDFAPAARQAIRDGLDSITFGSDRAEVLEALLDRDG